MSNIDRRTLVKASLAAMMAGAAFSRGAFAQSSEPILLGVSGPLTGPNAQYGTQWKQGFDLALDEIQAAGGINGRKLTYNFEDSQSDPRQSVAIAQKFVSDPRVVLELGDFSSPASMAASPIYQRAGLVQLGPGRVQCAVSLGRGLRGVLQVCLGRLQTLLDLVLLVLEVVRVGVGRGGRCRGHGERDRGRQEALPRGGGEVANHEGSAFVQRGKS